MNNPLTLINNDIKNERIRITFIILIYFFFNSLFLPAGLLYTILFTPFLFFFVAKREGLNNILPFFYITIPFAFIHYLSGVFTKDYAISYAVLFCTFIFLLAAKKLFQSYEELVVGFMQNLITINFIFCIIAVLLLPIPAVKNALWYLPPISKGIYGVVRLKMFTYEASYYSLLLVPLALYYLSFYLFVNKKKMIMPLLMLLVPLLISFSLGVWICLGITILLLCLIYTKRLDILTRRRIRIAAFLLFGTMTLLVIVQPGNPLFQRIRNVLNGDDYSARGRTTEAFYLAYKVAKTKSLLFGIGLGNIKTMGHSIIVKFYNNIGDNVKVSRIPNAVAETLAMFGIFGLLIRFYLQAFFFVKTKVWGNPYRMGVFIFIFIYQFTGSFLNNSVELVLWAMAFSGAFTIFKNPTAGEDIAKSLQT
ncbi:MAG TPA: hypothetical protein VN721_17275 [Flavipsychrobacter sp.]|nr:hypothetical protein [Flavipsychrobacter sp.]